MMIVVKLGTTTRFIESYERISAIYLLEQIDYEF